MRDVAGTGRDGINRAPQCLGAGGAQIFHTRHRDVRKAQCHGQRQRRLANALLVKEHAQPCRTDLIALHARITQRFANGFDHEVVRATIPALPELRAPHADDGDFIADTACHGFRPALLSRNSA